MDRIILHCDCNSFYASVELLSYPHLRDVPVAVCGDPASRHGIILAKNEAAKRYNIQTAQTVYSAKRLCPSLTLLPAHHARYTQYSRQINAIYERFTDLVEPFGIDESWLDITHSWQLFGETPLEVAHAIRRTVKAETGLTISVGVSFNKVFAKLGSDYKKPDAVTVFDRNNFKRLVWPLPAGAMLYVGKSAQKTLADLGVHNLGQLAGCDVQVLQRSLGKMGVELWRYARGEDTAPVRSAQDKQDVKSVGNGMTFRRNLVCLADAKAGIASLADEVATRLRHHNLRATSVQIVVKDTNLKSISRQKKLAHATYLAKELSDGALELLCAHWDFANPIRMLTITALQLTDGTDVEQLSLLENEAPDTTKREQLEKSMDAIRQKFGHGAIASANILGNDIGIDTYTEP